MIEKINSATIVEEVLSQFKAYNEALDAGDAEALNRFFWESSSTVRFGPTETLFGIQSIFEFRLKQWKAPASSRKVIRVVVTTLGDDVATTNALFRGADGKTNRQSQTWARFSEGWKIVAAHVSASPMDTTTT